MSAPWTGAWHGVLLPELRRWVDGTRRCGWGETPQRLSRAELEVGRVLCHISAEHQTHTIAAPIGVIAERTGFSYRWVWECLHRLVRHGFVAVVSKGGRPGGRNRASRVTLGPDFLRRVLKRAKAKVLAAQRNSPLSRNSNAEEPRVFVSGPHPEEVPAAIDVDSTSRPPWWRLADEKSGR